MPETKTKQLQTLLPKAEGYTQTVSLKFLHIAPRKVKRVADVLNGLPVQEAEAELLLQKGRPSEPLLKLLRSALANAKNQNQNPDALYIQNVRVEQGPMMKRFLPRAHGRATELQKKMSHIYMTVSETENAPATRFTISPVVKEKKGAKKRDTVKPQNREERQGPRAEKKGFFKKMFRRKSV